MTSEAARSIRNIFLRRLITTGLTVATVCLAVIVVVCLHLRNANERELALRQGRFIEAALVPGPGGDIIGAVDRFRERYDEFLAVGEVGTTGELTTVHPDRRAYRDALKEALDVLVPKPRATEEPPESVTISIAAPDTGEARRVTAVMAVLAEDMTSSPRRVVLLMAAPPGIRTVYFATMLLWPICVAVVMMFASIYQWFDSSMTLPLRKLAAALSEPMNGEGHRRRAAAGGGRELVQIAHRFDELMRSLSETQARQELYLEDVCERLKDRQAGLDQKLRRAEDRAMIDPITRLRNRAFLEVQLEGMFERHRDAETDLSVVMFDLDYFKQHNDRYGHQSGDELLAFAGSLLSGNTRAEDVGIRYGGDEFLLLLPGIDPDQGARIAERIIKMFAQHTRQFRQEPIVSMSAGVAALRRDAGMSGQDLVSKADRALYRAKHGGKNAVAAFSAA